MRDAEIHPIAHARRPIALADAWLGARIGNRTRRAMHEAERAAERRAMAEIDLGEPGVPRVVVAFLLVAIFTTLVEFQRFGTSPTARELDAAGGMSAVALARGDWWQVVTANLLHGGIQHLVLNVFIIYLVGRWLELLVGRWTVVAVVGVSALATAAGAVLAAPLTVSIGASGVAFGMLGCALVADPRARTHVGVLARMLAIVNVIGTFVIAGISIGGHLGGLAGGALVGLLVWDRRPTDGHPIGQPRARVAVALALASFALLTFLASWAQLDAHSAQRSGEDVAQWLVRIRTEGSLAG